MGRGSSKAGSARRQSVLSVSVQNSTMNGGKALAEGFNETKAQQEYAQALYDNPKTMAFPAQGKTLHVPALEQMKETMDNAPIGTTVVGNYYGRGMLKGNESIRVLEKASNTTWAMTDVIKRSDGTYDKHVTSKIGKGKALEQMQMALNEAGQNNVDIEYLRAYKGK